MDRVREQAGARLLTHRAMVLGFIAAIVRDPDLVEDVFQNVAVVVLDKAGAVEADKDFPAWVRGVARLEAFAALRRRRKAPTLLDPVLLDMLESAWSANDAAEPADPALGHCLGRLSSSARRLIELRYAEGLSGKAVAERLNRSPNTVYVALSRAYRCLAECVRRRLGQEGAPHE
jgi:RNA polymerase sigma factor (sigma-70 family)